MELNTGVNAAPPPPLTDAAQRSVQAAVRKAAAEGTSQWEPEHLLLALLTSDAGPVWPLLTNDRRDVRRLREGAEAVLAELLPRPNPAETPQPSPRAARVLSEAGDEARQMSSPQIDTPHLLLGLLDEGGAAAHLLRQHGLEAQALRHSLRQPGKKVETAPDRKQSQPRQAARPPVVVGPLRRVLPRLIDWRAVIVLGLATALGGWLTTVPEYTTPGVLLFIFAGWIISLCAHEFAHAFAADLGGDQSIRERGYLSFNPLAYTHLLLSIILPLIFLLLGGLGLPGGAVYVDRSRLRSRLWDSLVSAAGPLASLLVALVLAFPFMIGVVDGMFSDAPALWGAVALLVLLNVSGVILNCLPIPPLDGFGMLAPWLDENLRARLYGFSFFGIWILFLALRYVAPFRQALWGTVDVLLSLLGVDPGLAGYGLSLFLFWQ